MIFCSSVLISSLIRSGCLCISFLPLRDAGGSTKSLVSKLHSSDSVVKKRGDDLSLEAMP